MYLPGIPGHVVQRGNDRNPRFFEEENYLFFLNCLKDACRRYRELFRTDLDARDVHDVRKTVAFSVTPGNDLFKEGIFASSLHVPPTPLTFSFNRSIVISR